MDTRARRPGPCRPSSGLLLRAAGTLALASSGACHDSPKPPEWRLLAEDFEPRPLAEIAEGWDSSGPGAPRVRPHEEGPDVWLETELGSADWAPGDTADTYWAERPREGAFGFVPRGPTSLVAEGTRFRLEASNKPPEPGTYAVVGDRVYIALAPGTAPPPRTTYGVRVANGRAVDGTWRVRAPRRAAAGIPVWSGSREVLIADIPARSTLRFAASAPAWSDDLELPRSFRVQVNGELVHESELGAGEVWREVRLPESGAKSAELAFEVEGEGLGLFLVPTIGPAEVGGYARRPWESQRPNVVLFVADTFRADNLALHGGDPAWTPNLNRLAERSLAFENARAAAAWTLPSIATLLTGLYPGQHGATDNHLALSPELDTLAERFRRFGYRTGAVTDAGFFSILYGMDQGFEWFGERQVHEWDLDETLELARRFLERDDGRPMLLVVHTYRTHGPYREGPEEDETLWRELLEDGLTEFDGRDPLEVHAGRRIALRYVDRWLPLYRSGARDLDQGFGSLLDELERRGVLRSGFLVFTSDHGEAFGENQEIWHGGKLWDVKLRIPLLLHGTGLSPRRIPWAVSLADVPPTLAALAGLPDDPSWVGRSLLTLEEERLGLSFRLEEDARELAVHDGTFKVLARPDTDALRRGEHTAAFDLSDDPAEEEDLLGSERAVDLTRRAAAEVETALQPSAGPHDVKLDPESRAQLEEIGYGGG